MVVCVAVVASLRCCSSVSLSFIVIVVIVWVKHKITNYIIYYEANAIILILILIN